MRIGDLTILPVHDGTSCFPVQEFYQLVGTQGLDGLEREDWEPHRSLLTKDAEIEIELGGYLITGSGDRVILVDLGLGPTPLGSPLGPYIGGEYMKSLAEHGIAPGDVTDVVFTHLHPDHIGWTGPNGTATFANATYRCDRRDWSHFFDSDERTHADLSPAVAQLELWDGDTSLFPGVDVRLAAGHTPGSSMVILSSGSARGVLLGDVVHCPVELLEDEWSGLGDVDPELAARTRRAVAQEFEGTNVPMAAAHFPGLEFGRLLRGEGKRQWTFG